MHACPRRTDSQTDEHHGNSATIRFVLTNALITVLLLLLLMLMHTDDDGGDDDGKRNHSDQH